MRNNRVFSIIALSVLAYGSLLIVAGEASRYTSQEWLHHVFFVCPWLLLWASLKAWHCCYVWRGMLAKRYQPPALSRGRSAPAKLRYSSRPHILEHVCFALVVLSIAAILVQLRIGYAGWWVGSFLAGWLCLSIIVRKVC